MMQVLSPDVAAALVSGLFGLIVGSFANVVIYRLPLEQSIVFPASRCPRCLTAIKPWQNVPVFSWIFLRGRCASCGAPISFRYPVVEAIHGLGFASVVLTFGLSPFTPVLLLFFFALVVLAFIDWDHQILPNRITLSMTAIGLASSLVPGSLVSWRQSLFAAALGYLSFFVVAEGYARLRGIEGLGMGDWKLAAMVGAFLGAQHLLLVVFLGSLSGMVYGLTQALRQRRALAAEAAVPELPAVADGAPVEPAPAGSQPDPASAPEAEPELTPIGLYRLPFGTFLAAAAVFVLFLGDRVLIWYSGFFRS